ncbi:hypothetical protein H0266_07320 [Halobacillus locisalis]|uniref:Helix-turn-helix domain-containing protein n=1 Tax=Halobacillus locisalis TaxID=220753 RepID=A0A838CRQ2_9BACI|nr:hypothetical protein [Halobacillus locisalis]
MSNLYHLVKESQSAYQVKSSVIDTFEPKIKSSLRLTSRENREDLEQELKLHVIHYIRNYKLDDVPGLFELNRQKAQ